MDLIKNAIKIQNITLKKVVKYKMMMKMDENMIANSEI